MTDVVDIVTGPVELVEVLNGGMVGARGAAGPTGAAGPDGLSAYQVAVANDFVGDEDAWLASLDGSDGSPGSPGVAGRTVLYGTATPTNQGVDGDFYIDTTAHTIYGPKATTWPAGTSLVGPAGSNGSNGSNGTNGTNGVDGAAGPGVATGGTTGQVLAKTSNADYATGWSDPHSIDPVYLDLYTNFLLNSTPFVATQGGTATTLTADAAHGATTLAVTSGASFPNGTLLVTNAGTATQQQHTVSSGGGTTTLTITPAVDTALSAGATVMPVWTNSTHLTNTGAVGDGFSALFYWAVHQVRADNSLVLQNPGTKPVTFLGNSWFSQGATVAAAAVHGLYPSATVDDAGVSGNGSGQMIARFATDVPANSAYVYFNEPGVNDVTNGVTPTVMAANLATLVGLIRGIGAIPVYMGPVPLYDKVTASALAYAALTNAVSVPAIYPGVTLAQGDSRWARPVTPNIASYGLGNSVLQSVTTGDYNTAIGWQAQKAVTTGLSNTAVGEAAQTHVTTGHNNVGIGDSAQLAMTTGQNNTAVGSNTQNNVTSAQNNTAVGTYCQLSTTGGDNTSLGFQAHRGLTSGTSNTAVGYGALYSPGGVAANTSSTALRQTAVGKEAGQNSTTQNNDVVAVGYQALVGGAGAVAIGSGASATAAGAIAIGMDSASTPATSTVANQAVIGTALTTLKVNNLNVAASVAAKATVNVPHGTAPTAPVDGDIWTTSAGLFAQVNGVTKTTGGSTKVAQSNVALGAQAAGQSSFTWYTVGSVCARGLIVRFTVTATASTTWDLEVRGAGSGSGTEMLQALGLGVTTYSITVPWFYENDAAGQDLFVGIKNYGTSAATFALATLQLEKFA